MKKLLILFLFLYASSVVVAQSDAIDDRLLVKYTKQELVEMKNTQPEAYTFLTHCLNKAWYISPLPKEKMKDNNGRIGKIVIKDIDNINFFALNIKIIKDDYQFFAIEGTEKMLVVKSEDHIRKELK